MHPFAKKFKSCTKTLIWSFEVVRKTQDPNLFVRDVIQMSSSSPMKSPPSSPGGRSGNSSPLSSSHRTGPSVLTSVGGRARFMTEETIPVRNFAHLTMTLSNPFRSRDEEDEDEVVSAISEDSLRRINHDYNPELDVSFPVPKEIVVPVSDIEVPGWMKEMKDSSRASKCASSVARPNLGRYFSAPPLKSPLSPRSLQTATIPEGCASLSGSLTGCLSSDTYSLLGDRPRKQPARGFAGPISVGSVVGQSSLKTSNTITTSSVTEHSFTHTMAAQRRLNELVSSDRHSRPRQSAVRRELRYMLYTVSSPIRKMKQNRQKSNLQRASGCLT